MKKQFGACVSALPLVLLYAPAVVAQEIGADTFQVGVELDTQYDSNVANTSAARAETTNLEGSDVIFRPSLFMMVNKDLGGFQLQGNASAGYDFYAENTRLNSERLAAELNGNTRVGFCNLRPGLSFIRQQQQLNDRFFIDESDDVLDNVQTVQEYGLRAGCGQEYGLRALGGVSYARGDNSNELREFSDYESMTYTAGLGYHHPSVGELDLYASQEDTDYPNRVATGVDDTFRVRRYGASFERDIGARLKGRIEAFAIDLDVPGASETNFNGTGWDFDLSATIGARTTAYVTAGRDVQPVLNNDALYTKSTSLGGGVSYAVNDRVTLSGSYTRLDRTYVYSGVLPADEEARLVDDDLNLFSASANFRGSGPLGFTLYGGYEDRSSNDPFYDYDGFFAGVKLRYLFIR